MVATIKDVAKQANVSPSTVSRVIGDNPRISDKTKKRVIEAIRKLNYHPNEMARSLQNNKSRIIALILPNEADDLFENPFFIQAMSGISAYIQKHNYNIMYSFGKAEKDELNIIKNYINAKLVDGIILLTSREEDKCIEYLKDHRFPFVVIGRPENPEDILWVNNDNFQAMYNVVNTMAARGKKRIAYIGGPKGFNLSKDRYDGYVQALRVNGFPLEEGLIRHGEDYTEHYGYNCMKEILSKGKPDAVVTTDDLLAFGAMKAMKELNETHISIVGFNNTPLAAFQSPSLSTVDINPHKLGYTAAKLLLAHLNKERNLVNHEIVETTFIERDSTRRL